MDFDFGAYSTHSTKHNQLSAVQAARLHSDNSSLVHYTDDDDDDRSDFRCPFCDFEIEATVLCSRLEQEYCFDLKNAVCPVCEENLGNDAIRQFTQHSSSRKMWKSEISSNSIWSGNSAMLGKKLAAWENESIPDQLLSPFVCNVSVLNPDSIHPVVDSNNNASDISVAKGSGTDASDKGDEDDHQERRKRAAFVQELVLSTIFEEIWS